MRLVLVGVKQEHRADLEDCLRLDHARRKYATPSTDRLANLEPMNVKMRCLTDRKTGIGHAPVQLYTSMCIEFREKSLFARIKGLGDVRPSAVPSTRNRTDLPQVPSYRRDASMRVQANRATAAGSPHAGASYYG